MITTFSEYRSRLGKWKNKGSEPMPARLACLGLIGETGEVVDLIKKAEWHGIPLTKEKVKLECGDVLWYIDAIAERQGLTLAEINRTDVLSPFLDAYKKEEDIVDNALSLGACVGNICDSFVDEDSKCKKEDLGWALCFIECIANIVGVDMREVAQANVDKLEARYPNGFVEGGGIR